MLTSNFYKYHAAIFCGASSQRYNLAVRDTSGKARTVFTYDPSNGYVIFFGNNDSTSMSTYGIHFGDGTAEPTKDDYNLSGNRVTGLTERGRTRDVSHTEDTVTLTETITLTNTNSDTVTISEIAWIKNVYCDNFMTGYFLFDRTLLDTPVTIPAGEDGIIMYKRSVTIPT